MEIFHARTIEDALLWVETHKSHRLTMGANDGLTIIGEQGCMTIDAAFSSKFETYFKINTRKYDTRNWRANDAGRRLLRKCGIRFEAGVGAVHPGIHASNFYVGQFMTIRAYLYRTTNRTDVRQAAYVYTMGARRHFALGESGELYEFSDTPTTVDNPWGDTRRHCEHIARTYLAVDFSQNMHEWKRVVDEMSKSIKADRAA